MVISISNSTLNDVLTMDIAKETVTNEELRRKKQEIVNELQALVTEKKKKGGEVKAEDLTKGMINPVVGMSRKTIMYAFIVKRRDII